MTYIPDALDQFKKHDREQAEQLQHLPQCTCCEEPIQQSRAVCINDEWFCNRCLRDYYTREVLPEW